MPDPILATRQLTVTAHGKLILNRVDLRLHPGEVLGIVGPSGAGKSTLLRSLNRLLDLQTGYRVQGEILFHNHSVHHASVDPDLLRQRIGILFQQPIVFPTSIERNVLFGVSPIRRLKKPQRAECLENSLREAALWDEVKDRLHDSALRLSIGQQQRLCLARTLALDPEIILMDEPTSALDRRTTESIENSILQMKTRRAIVLVTHNLEQARRVTDWVACLCADQGYGEVLESACCDAFFASETCHRVFDSLSQPSECTPDCAPIPNKP